MQQLELEDTFTRSNDPNLCPKVAGNNVNDNKTPGELSSLVTIYVNATSRRASTVLLGENVTVGEWHDWRVKWGQSGVACTSLAALCLFLVGNNGKMYTNLTITAFALNIFFMVLVSYKNISFKVLQKTWDGDKRFSECHSCCFDIFD